VQAIIDTIIKSKEPITLIAVGSVTNVAEAIKRRPEITKRARLVVMGGCIDGRPFGRHKKCFAETNVRAYPKAAQIAYGADWDFIMAPLDTAAGVVLEGDLYTRFRDSKNKLAQTVMENYRYWVKGIKWHKNDLPDYESTRLFDTVAVYLAFADDYCEMHDLNIRVSDEGHTDEDPAGKPARVALKWKDLDAFKKFIVNRITNYKVPRK